MSGTYYPRFGTSEERLNSIFNYARSAHWSDEDIVEIMGVIGLFGFLNRWNDSMGSALEDLPTQAGKKYLGSNWTVGKRG